MVSVRSFLTLTSFGDFAGNMDMLRHPLIMYSPANMSGWLQACRHCGHDKLQRITLLINKMVDSLLRVGGVQIALWS